MGRTLFDRFTFLHMFSGYLAYHVGFSEVQWLLFHTAFEILENSPSGVAFLRQVTFWPGGKTHPDAWINVLGDTVGTWVGFRLAQWMDPSAVKSPI